jgi:hypothetical protein
LRSQVSGVARRGDELKRRIAAQPRGVVRVFVAGRELIQALSQQRRRLVGDVPPVAAVFHTRAHVRRESQDVVEVAQQHQAGIRGQLSAREIDDKFWLETKAKLRITLCSHRSSSSRDLSGLSTAKVARLF